MNTPNGHAHGYDPESSDDVMDIVLQRNRSLEIAGFVLNSIIPIATLVWTVSSGFWFWSATFGNVAVGIAFMVIVEMIGLIGLILHLMGWDQRNFLVRARIILPFMPLPSLLFAIHELLTRHARWIHDMAAAVAIPHAWAVWAFTAIGCSVILIVSRFGWKTIEEEIDNRVSGRIARARFRLLREINAIHAQRIEALIEAHLEHQRLKARVGALKIMVPIHRAQAADAQKRAERAAAQLEAAQHALRTIRDATQTLPDEEDDVTLAEILGSPTDIHKDMLRLQVAVYLAAGWSQKSTADAIGRVDRRTIGRWVGDTSKMKEWGMEQIRQAPPEMLRIVLRSIPAEVAHCVQHLLPNLPATASLAVSVNGASDRSANEHAPHLPA